jgi:hypothetical protein
VAAGVRRLRAAAATGVLLLLAACSETPGESDDPAAAPPAGEETSEAAGHDAHPDAKPGKLLPLRKGEQRLTLTMPEPYTPSAPTGKGNDDYRCFLLDPELAEDSYLTGTNVLPGNPDVVHHVILFRVPPDQVDEAERLDDADQGEGWTCFGGPGLPAEMGQLDDAPWLGAWAPGGSETKTPDGYGVDLPRGSQIVMQVHYNLLADVGPDTSSTQIRLMSGERDLTSLHAFLMPAPVELPCRPGHDSSPLCDRDAALADARERFGMVGGAMAEGLHYLCGGRPRPGEVTSCTRTLSRPMTVLGAAGHMHLLGREIRLEVNPDTPEARTVLDIKVWDFDNQGARPIRPVHLDAGDTVKVTCRHVQWLRDKLPAFEGQEEKYVVWGEGTTDEMCLGLLSVAFD